MNLSMTRLLLGGLNKYNNSNIITLDIYSASGILILWQQKSWRNSCDWCELEACKRLLPSEDEQESGDFLYQESPQMIDYKWVLRVQ